MITRTLQQHILLTLAFLALAFMPVAAEAATLSVVFEQTPLFSNSNVTPGDSVSRTVVVTNNGTEIENVYVSIDKASNNGLADVMELSITDSSPTSYFNDTFINFFAATPVSLGTLGAGATRTYTFTASLDSSTGNAYQKSSMGFDLIVGFEGGDSVTDNECVTDCGGGGGGGGGGGSSRFILFNEQVDVVNTDVGGAVLSWDTNRNSTTYLVCGNTANGPFVLNTDQSDFFGYEFEVSEDTAKVVDHTAVLTGLTPGTYECRPASREDISDDFTVGIALTFTLPTGGNFFGVGGGAPFGDVLGASTSTGDEGTASPEGLVEGLAANIIDAVKSAMTDTAACVPWWLLILAAMSFLWTVIDDKLRHPPALFARIFTRGVIFDALYTIAVLLGIYFGFAGAYWWVFVLAWLAATVLDYRGHHILSPMWNPRIRNLYFAAASIVVLILGSFTPILCVAWPFVVIAAGSIILLFFDDSSV
ncbi:hypothetical protein GW943_02410 [Candidatus Parcubacteria bacterium]|uniref:DUF11 domain-containing protein n=1 Tax=Candidatus Kaiserbacteria bacterium CG10_big_fil_rev_8_21_14_0_10_47_16 TaxID=1974608 RepID=A0A2H0UDP8_9BACT|nr:hypothetical protein [Candidatus Parcubacteria bacterium]PIR84507.1 MAG: hypothetical protein COU16_02940 [Candidatus Kaiserbacteria bacterium CG10_big_fil_rev_8_21_14_0_10_47_16]